MNISTKSLQHKNFLVIEDEPSMLSLVREVLSAQGAKTEGAMDARKGVSLAVSGRFDAIILDRYLDIDGHYVLEELKKYSKTSNLPVVMLTGEKNMDEVKKSLQLGAAGYIIKPFKPNEFVDKLNKILGRVFL